MDFKKFYKSKYTAQAIRLAGILALALFVFQAGIYVGYRKASYSYQWGDNYYRTFGERKGGLSGQMPGFEMMDPTNAHGITGKILNIDLPKMMIVDRDNIEKTVIFTDSTNVRKFRDVISPTDLVVGDIIIVIGDPDTEGTIQAKLVRIMPPPPISQ